MRKQMKNPMNPCKMHGDSLRRQSKLVKIIFSGKFAETDSSENDAISMSLNSGTKKS